MSSTPEKWDLTGYTTDELRDMEEGNIRLQRFNREHGCSATVLQIYEDSLADIRAELSKRYRQRFGLTGI